MNATATQPRTVSPERMDDPTLDGAEHARALRALQRVHAFSGPPAGLWATLRRLARRPGRAPGPVRVLDVGCGDGAVLRMITEAGRRRGLRVVGHGVDISARALDLARAGLHGRPLTFERRDVITDGLPGGFDLALSTLFLHHLSDEHATAVLAAMRDGAHAGIVDDLRRGRWPYAFTWLGTRVITRCDVVHADGPLSVRAGWTADELHKLARQAGIASPAVRRRIPFRLTLSWYAAHAEGALHG